MSDSTRRQLFPVQDYDLATTLTSGQAFRWRRAGRGWEGVIGSRWTRLIPSHGNIVAETVASPGDWRWLVDYLQIEVDLPAVLATFPDDVALQAAKQACRGLRLLRQEPWECLASFILSSTKQIVQIQQIITLLCQRFGEPVATPSGQEVVCAFPTYQRIAACSEAELRACKMGFRAPYMRGTAQMLTRAEVNLNSLQNLTYEQARAELLQFPGVGPKIADCVLLFAYGFPEAFPVDVWVMKALRQLYFPRRRVRLQRLQRFAATHFGPQAGYAQQYLFHYMRVLENRTARPASIVKSRPPQSD